MHFTGYGSMLAVHMTPVAPRTPADAAHGNARARDLFFFDMLRDGFWLARRGMMTVSYTHLDVYKRQAVAAARARLRRLPAGPA